jgi:hypothetical protein
MEKQYVQHFVEDGCERTWKANYAPIRMEVDREYAERLQVAGYWERWRLRLQMHREIRRRLERVAPLWGLYFS